MSHLPRTRADRPPAGRLAKYGTMDEAAENTLTGSGAARAGAGEPTAAGLAAPLAGFPVEKFVALGDSFTEGLEDPDPRGGYRGWADRFAEMLAITHPGLRYANLAVRGKMLGEVVTDQLPVALTMAPALVSVAAGGNDLLRPSADPD